MGFRRGSGFGSSGGGSGGGGTVNPGTATHLSRYIDATHLGDSVATDDGTTFSIGTNFYVTETTGNTTINGDLTVNGTNTIINHNLTVVGPDITINTVAYHWPNSAGAGSMNIDGSGNVSFGPPSLSYAANYLLVAVINKTGMLIPAGPIILVGYDAVSGKLKCDKATPATTADLIILAALPDGNSTNAYRGAFDITSNVDASLAFVGDPVYVGAAGGYTLTDPTAAGSPTSVRQIVARVKTAVLNATLTSVLGLKDDPDRNNLLKLPRGTVAGQLIVSQGASVDAIYSAAATTPDAAAMVLLAPTGAATKPLVIQGQAFQSANLFELQNSGGAQLLQFTESAYFLVNPAAAATGSPNLVLLTAPAHTNLANAEATDVLFNLARTVTFTGGGASITAQRAVYIQAPVYAAGAAQTITVAATLAISGAPTTSGGNVTLTNSYALRVSSGSTSLGADKFIVDGNGAITKLNNVAIASWPGSNTVGYLKNDGSGNLTWAAAGGGAYPTGSIALTDGATISVDATLGNYFWVVLGGNRTLAAPTGGVDGQVIRIEVAQDGTGTRTLNTAAYLFGTDITGITLTTTINKRDLITAIYSSRASGWMITGFVKGYA